MSETINKEPSSISTPLSLTSAKTMRWLVWFIYIIMITTIVLAWIFYPVSYPFWDQATSTLGGLYARDTTIRNFPSVLIFSTGFVFMAGLAIFIAVVYFRNQKQFRFAIVKGVLLIFVSLGAIGIAIPYDYEPLTLFHQIGAFVFLSGIAILNFSFQLLHCMAKYFPQCEDRDLDYYVDFTFVVLLILAAIMYFATETITYFWPSIPWLKASVMQKVLLFTAVIAAGLLDLDDIK